MKGKKRLLESHKILLQEKGRRITEMKIGFNNVLDLIAEELGVPANERDRWRLSEDGEAFEMTEESK